MRSSFIRWAGSKKKLVPIIKTFWDTKYSRYFEPFMGSAQLFFSIKPQQAFLSDINNELIDSFKEVKKNANEVYDLFLSYPKNEKFYYELRKINKNKLSDLEIAARFFYLNRYCFNGLYRVNNEGEFNVPYGGKFASAFPSRTEFLEVGELFKKVKFYTSDFEEIILKKARKNDFIYLDPPYTNKNKRIFNTYGNPNKNNADIYRLVNVIEYIDSIGAKFVLSYSYNNEIKELFSKWNKRRVITSRCISGFMNARRRAAELLITNINE